MISNEFYIAGLDDAPRIDIQPARNWRYQPPQRPKPAELLWAAGAAFVIAIGFWVAVVCFFV